MLVSQKKIQNHCSRQQKNKNYSTPINFGNAKTTSINDLQEYIVTSTY